MKLDPGAKLKPRPKRYKRSQLEIRYDERGLPALLETYKKYRTYLGENEAERETLGAVTDAGRRLWRKRAKQGEQPFYEVFSAIEEVEKEAAAAKVPALFDEIEKRDPYKAYGLYFPRLKYRRDDEAKRIAVDASHAMVVKQLIEGLVEYLEKVLDAKTAKGVVDAIYVYVEAFEGDLTDARTGGAGAGDGDEGESADAVPGD